MNKLFLLLFIQLLGIIHPCFSQSVAINTSGNAPNSKAMLDVDVTTKGILIPRLTDAQRNAISGPATGLVLYNTTTDRLNFWNGTAWYSLATTTTASTNVAGTNTGSGVAINTSGSSAHHSAILDISGTDGVLVPRMTTAQRGSIASPTTGLVVYNLTTNKLNYRSSTAWVEPCSTSIVNTTGATTTPGVAINTDGATANASALLDITSTSQGLKEYHPLYLVLQLHCPNVILFC